MSHALGSCGICQNGWRYSEPFEDPIDDSVTPGRTEVTLDIPHLAYTAASLSPALQPLVTQVEASNYYQGMKRMDEKDIGLPLQWTPVALAQAVLDQQVLKRAFIEEISDRSVEFVENWPQITPARGADGQPEKHVHARFRIEGEAVSPDDVLKIIRYAGNAYHRLSDEILSEGFSVDDLQTVTGRGMRMGLPQKRAL